MCTLEKKVTTMSMFCCDHVNAILVDIILNEKRINLQ